MRQKLNDKVVLITGAARGIGAETARRLVTKGARVSLVGLEPDRLAALAGELGDRAVWFEADVTDQDAVDGAVAGTVRRVRRRRRRARQRGHRQQRHRRHLPRRRAGQDARGQPHRRRAHRLRRAARTSTQRRGYVCIISSTAAFTMMPGMSAYAASKAGVEQFANCLRLEVAHKGVKVGSVHPGWIDTDLVRDQRADLKTFDAAMEKFPYPLNATTSVEDCADAIVDGMERRRSRVYVPRAIGGVQALRTVFTGPVASWLIRREAKTIVPELEAELVKLGRHFGSSSVALTPGAAEEREKLAS